MDEAQTKDFIEKWNRLNGFSNGIVVDANMRYISPGIVTWNAYDAPELNINQFIEIYNSITA